MEGEILFILVLALIVLGPRRLPEIGRQIGKALAELRRAKWEFTRQIEDELRRIEEEEVQAKAARALPAPAGTLVEAKEAAPAAEAAAENKILPPASAPAGTIGMELTPVGAEVQPAPGSAAAEAAQGLAVGHNS